MILHEVKWSTGRETLYSVCGGWMNVYGAMVEWYWQGKTEVRGEKHYTVWVVDEWMSMEQWWNDTDRENWSAGRKTLHRVGGRWMNEYGAMEEWYWEGKTKVLGEKHYTAWVADEWVWSNGGMIVKGKTEVLGGNPTSVTIWPPEISKGLSWNRTRSSGARLKTNINVNYI